MTSSARRVPPDELDEITIAPGMARSELFSSEFGRRWRTIWEDPEVTWLRHAGGAVIEIRWAEFSAKSITLHEGEAAAAADFEWGHRFKPDLLERLHKIIVPGAQLLMALQRELGPRHLSVIFVDVLFESSCKMQHVLRAGGVVVVKTDADLVIDAARYLQGKDAAAALADTAYAPTRLDQRWPLAEVETWQDMLARLAERNIKPVRCKIQQAFDPVRYCVEGVSAAGASIEAEFTIKPLGS